MIYGQLNLLYSDLDAEPSTQLFSECLSLMLADLKRLSFDGFPCNDLVLFPLLYCYVHDHPEGAKVWYYVF